MPRSNYQARSRTCDPECREEPHVQFPAAAIVPTYDVVFSIRHSPIEGHPTILRYDWTPVGSVNSTRCPASARMPSDASYGPQGLNRSGSNANDYRTESSDQSAESSLSTVRTCAVAGSHHAIMGGPSASEQHPEQQSCRTRMGDQISATCTVVGW